MQLTWFGHSAFRIAFGDVRIMIDPFLTGNPAFTGDVAQAAADCTHVLVTHGHNDHLGDTLAICKATEAQLVAAPEICDWLGEQGVKNTNPGNHGGSVDCGGFTTAFVKALHSSSYERSAGKSVYLGNPLGLVIRAEGEPTLYHMGDTGIFGDMGLIHELYEPEIGIVPIGDRYTMGGKTAALACRRYFKFRTIIPCHYGTFPALDPNPDVFRTAMGGDAAKIVVPKPGEALEM